MGKWQVKPTNFCYFLFEKKNRGKKRFSSSDLLTLRTFLFFLSFVTVPLYLSLLFLFLFAYHSPQSFFIFIYQVYTSALFFTLMIFLFSIMSCNYTSLSHTIIFSFIHPPIYHVLVHFYSSNLLFCLVFYIYFSYALTCLPLLQIGESFNYKPYFFFLLSLVTTHLYLLFLFYLSFPSNSLFSWFIIINQIFIHFQLVFHINF